MRRSTQVLLVLMGGGVVGAAAIPLLRAPDCDPAVQVDGRCESTGGSSHSSATSYGGSGSTGSHSSGVATGAAAGAAVGAVAGAAAARGGFGSTGSAHAGSSGG